MTLDQNMAIKTQNLNLSNTGFSKVNNAQRNVHLKDEIAYTAKKINYWALCGLIFLTLGIIATAIATCGLNQIIFQATVATLDATLGMGACAIFIGTISITKALIDRNAIINNPKRYGLVGITNLQATCWLNSLMQMLLNISDIKNSLRLNPHFKEFIDSYQNALNKDQSVNTLRLKKFLKTKCPDVAENTIFHDSHEVLVEILNLCANLDLQNTLIERKHYLHQDGTRSVSELKTKNKGSISLPPPRKSKKDTLTQRLDEYFISIQNQRVNEIATVITQQDDRSLLGRILKRKKDVTTDVVIGEKTLILEENKLQFAPKNLFLNIQRYEYDPTSLNTRYVNNSVDIPFMLKLNKKYLEDNQSSTYELLSFIRYIDSHYIAYVKKNGSWFKCDDNDVKKISLDEAKNASKLAYLVHYKKL